MNYYNGFSPAQRMKAYNWLKTQWAEGTRITRGSCDACGQDEGIIEAHSEDYSEPYGDHIGKYTLCFRCHMAVHCRFRSAGMFTRYCDSISQGLVFEPFYKRDFNRFKREQLQGWNLSPAKTVEAKGNFLMEMIKNGYAKE